MHKISCKCASCKSKRGEYIGEANPRFGDIRRRDLVRCNQCNKKFLKYKNRIREHNFCNKKCEGLWLKEHRSGSLNPFFNRKHTSNNREKILKYLRTPHQETCQCLVCKSKRNEPHQKNCNCCSCASQRGEYKREKNGRWNNGSSKLPYHIDFSKELREQIRGRDNCCKVCGISNKEHIEKYGCSLSCHHIDYDKMNTNRENLISLCKKCHAKTNSNRKYWRKYFRENLYGRY